MATTPTFAAIRIVNRVALPCILDAVMASRQGREFLDALILLAVVQANVAPVTRDPEISRAYATVQEAPPDELRRPVSINAIAQSLRMPYETVRRRILRLAQADACEVGPQGVIVPTRELTTPEHVAALFVVWEQIRRLYYRLRDVGCFDDLVRREDRERWAANAAEPPIRAVIRVASDYMLRAVEHLTRRLGSLTAGVIWIAVLRANTEALSDADRGGVSDLAADVAPDVRRRPIRIAELAIHLDASQETVRRYVGELTDAGMLVRIRGGLIVPAEALASPGLHAFLGENFTDLQRMFTAFAQFGILGTWDRQNPPLQGAA